MRSLREIDEVDRYDCEIKISGQPYHLEAGDFILMPPNEPHAVNALEKFKTLLVMIKS
ncbi:MAG: AraC family ligand binding domain-containing protein [Pseudothermotoga sp.]|uniref:cupin domain-containing protein n=1 Tax=Pseudothermotoga sp. TaxID=2033661 RepID=UPI000AEECBC1|nr:AraC family ligand binding domain-containing protein [Pseudothermotoga sp.]HBT40052.1 hypothetical protein [Pseudothermotoga sp.]HCO98405.1 hypothetical protein [Pseudothermotoga sp.]